MLRPIKTRLIKTGQITSFLTVIMLLTLMLPTVSLSATGDATKVARKMGSDEVQIQADYMKLDLETGSSTYRGNVSIIQGTIKLTGDKITITRKDNEIRDIQVDGNPARFLQDENTDNKVHATSGHMKYTAQANRLVMTIDASLEQSDRTVESQRIVYDTQNKVIIAGKDSSSDHKGDRVNITLTPKKNTPSKTGKQRK